MDEVRTKQLYASSTDNYHCNVCGTFAETLRTSETYITPKYGQQRFLIHADEKQIKKNLFLVTASRRDK